MLYEVITIRLDKMVPESVRRQKPLLKLAPTSPAAQDLFALAVKLQRLHGTMGQRIAAGPFLTDVAGNFE